MKKLSFISLILTILLFIGLVVLVVGICCKRDFLITFGILGSLAIYCFCQWARVLQELNNKGE